MKSFKLSFLFISIICVSLSCKKGSEDEGSDCEESHITKVTYTNNGTVPLRIEVATSLTPQYVPISPVFSVDLAPGASIVKEFAADQYFNVWYSNCATECTMYTYYSKTYEACGEYEEKHGF